MGAAVPATISHAEDGRQNGGASCACVRGGKAPSVPHVCRAVEQTQLVVPTCAAGGCLFL